jgi:UDP-N-acetylglucosamine enolpyruvyl transferase
MAEPVVVTNNLMDVEQFRRVAPALAVVRPTASALAAAGPALAAASVVMVDLRCGVDLAGLVASAGPVVAYGSHVDTDALAAARAAGCRDAVPRSTVFRRFANEIGNR